MSWLEGTPFAAIPGALLGGLVAGTLMPLLGMWVVLQRVVFLGVTLAQLAAAGVALALVLDLPVLPFALATTLLVVAVGATRKGRVSTLGDSTLGATFCAASALSLLFIARSAADMDEVQHVLHGNLIYATPEDVGLVALTLVGGLAALGLFFKELLFSTFDTETAAALGVRARLWQLLLFVVLAVSLSVSMRTTGSLLSFAMLVLPPLAALRLGLGLRGSFLAASALGLVGTLAGLTFAVAADLHLESSITLALFVLIPVCAGWHRHPILGLTLAAAAVGGAWLMRAELPEPEAGHAHHHDELVAEGTSFHADVELRARYGDGSVLVEWTLVAHRDDGDPRVPDQLWLLVLGDGVFHEHLLVADPHELPPGDSEHRGSFRLEVDGNPHRLDGQLWSGPSEALAAEPLDVEVAGVLGCDVQPD